MHSKLKLYLSILILCFVLMDAYVVFVFANKSLHYGQAIHLRLDLIGDGSSGHGHTKIEQGTPYVFICGELLSDHRHVFPLGFVIRREGNHELVANGNVEFSKGEFCKQVMLDWYHPIGRYQITFHFVRPIPEEMELIIIGRKMMSR